MALAPPGERFPAYPASWYLFGAARDLRTQPVSKSMLGRRLVAFRSANGPIALMDARCSHLGADLGRGRVVGEALQCPFHHWEYGLDGRCVRIPSQSDIPSFARQVCYPVVERHGYIFFFNGPEPLFPLPFFFDCRPEDFAAGKPFRFVAGCSWYMLAANGFDAEHFRTVHDRTLIGPPAVDCPAPLARRMRYTARVTGSSLCDRLIRWFAGDRVDVSITSWGGPFILVTGFFRRARSYILIATQPLDGEQTLVEVIVFARRNRHRLVRALLEPLSLWVRRRFTQAFMQDDIDRLGGIRYHPHALIDGDRLLREYFDWADSLPHGRREADGDAARGMEERSCGLNPNGALIKERQP